MIAKLPKLALQLVCIGLGLATVTLTCLMLFDDRNQRQGILLIKFARLRSREISFPGALGSLADGATSLLGMGTAVEGIVDSAAAHATSAVKSAIGAAESFIPSVLPHNMTVGTHYICASFATRSNCSRFEDSDSLLGASALVVPIRPVAMAILPAGSRILAAVLALTLFSLFATAVLSFLDSGLVRILSIVSQSLAILVSTVFCFGVTALCSILSGLPGIDAERGDAYGQGIATLVCCSALFVLLVVSWLL